MCFSPSFSDCWFFLKKNYVNSLFGYRRIQVAGLFIYGCIWFIMNRHLNWSNRTTEQWAWDHFSRAANWHPAFHPFGSGGKRVQSSFLKSAWPGRIPGLSHLPPFCCQLIARTGAASTQCLVPGIRRRKRMTTSPLDLLCWEIAGALKKQQIKRKQHKTPELLSTCKSTGKKDDNDEMSLLETKQTKKQTKTQTKPKPANFGLTNFSDTGLCKAALKATQPIEPPLVFVFIFIFILLFYYYDYYFKNRGLSAVHCTWWTCTFVSGISFVVSFILSLT